MVQRRVSFHPEQSAPPEKPRQEPGEQDEEQDASGDEEKEEKHFASQKALSKDRIEGKTKGAADQEQDDDPDESVEDDGKGGGCLFPRSYLDGIVDSSEISAGRARKECIEEMADEGEPDGFTQRERDVLHSE